MSSFKVGDKVVLVEGATEFDGNDLPEDFYGLLTVEQYDPGDDTYRLQAHPGTTEAVTRWVFATYVRPPYEEFTGSVTYGKGFFIERDGAVLPVARLTTYVDGGASFIVDFDENDNGSTTTLRKSQWKILRRVKPQLPTKAGVYENKSDKSYTDVVTLDDEGVWRRGRLPVLPSEIDELQIVKELK